MVSTCSFCPLGILSKTVLNMMTTYSPFGAYSSSVVYFFHASLRDLTIPNGVRKLTNCASHLSLVTRPLKYGESASQLSRYLPASTSASHALAASSALFSAASFCAQAGLHARTQATATTAPATTLRLRIVPSSVRAKVHPSRVEVETPAAATPG